MINGVAIKYDKFVMVNAKPKRHGDIINQMYEQTGRKTSGNDVQGFVTDQGDFLDREEAADYAIKCGQIEKLKWPPYLYSEDLW